MYETGKWYDLQSLGRADSNQDRQEDHELGLAPANQRLRKSTSVLLANGMSLVPDSHILLPNHCGLYRTMPAGP